MLNCGRSVAVFGIHAKITSQIWALSLSGRSVLIMGMLVSSLFFLAVGVCAAESPVSSPDAALEAAREQFVIRPFFVKNKGQYDEQVKYVLRGARGIVFFTSSEVVFSFVSTQASPENEVDSTASSLVFRFGFDGAQEDPEIIAGTELPGKINHFRGASENWTSDIPTFDGIVYKSLYEGINLHFYLHNNNLRYEIVLGENANPAELRFVYTGIDGLSITPDGDLVVQTTLGDFHEHPPPVQVSRGAELIRAKARFRILGEYILGFNIGTNSNTIGVDP